MELHYLSNRSVCLCGGVGTGKTTFIRDFLEYISIKHEKSEKIGSVSTTFNQYIDSMALYNFFMAKMDKVQTNKYGPKNPYQKIF